MNDGSLASVHDFATNAFIASLIPIRSVFGGYRDNEGSWRWTDQSEWNFEWWEKGQPSNNDGNEQYLEMIGPEFGRWNDVPLNYEQQHGFICQYDPKG